MTSCEQIEERIPELVMDTLDEAEKLQAEHHLATCEHCKTTLQEAAFLHKNMLALGGETVPIRLREETLSQVHAAFQQEAQVAGGLSLGRVLAAVSAGMGGVLLYLAILWRRVDLNTLPPPQLLAVAVFWGGLLIAACCWVLGRYRLRRLDLGFPALFGILTSGIAVLGLLFCPQETFFALWERSPLSQAIADSLGAGASYALFGLLYALPPALLVSAAMRSRPTDNLMGKGSMAAGLALLLWLPAVYLQCADLTAGLLLAWAGGALVGLFGGFWGGVGLRWLVPIAR